jgi:3-hydroxymyristoyl/3-hydroxydecanoyl-(acyl carrier protein) dehydratase
VSELSWTLLPDHPVFEGHFPGHPIVPGVLLLDFALREIERVHGAPIKGWRVASAKFLHAVTPPCRLACRLSSAASAQALPVVQFEIESDERIVATGSATPLD